jgi:MFS transporter, FHS family, L-fucose permease
VKYSAFLLGLFVIAAGMTCLETIANPYTTVLGRQNSGATRINIAQTFNGVGWILGPIVGGYFVFGGDDAAGGAPMPMPGLSTSLSGHRHFRSGLLSGRFHFRAGAGFACRG